MKSNKALPFLMVSLGLLAGTHGRKSREEEKTLCDYFDCQCKLIGGVPMCSKSPMERYCPSEPPKDLGSPVCGDDNKTYESAWHLAQESCISGKCLDIRYKGECSGGEDLCKHAICGDKCRLINGGVPKCIDEDGDEFCPSYGPPLRDRVCGSNGKTYANKWLLTNEACESNTPLKLLHWGECGQKACSRWYKKVG